MNAHAKISKVILSQPCGDGARSPSSPQRPAFWDPDAALAAEFAKINAGFSKGRPVTGQWRALSEDARGFGPAKLEGDR